MQKLHAAMSLRNGGRKIVDMPSRDFDPKVTGEVSFSGPAKIRRVVLISFAFASLYICLGNVSPGSDSYPAQGLWTPTAGLCFALLFGVSPLYAPLVLATILIGYGVAQGQQQLSSWIIAIAMITTICYTATAVVLRRLCGGPNALLKLGEIAKYLALLALTSLGSAALCALCGTRGSLFPPGRFWFEVWHSAAGDTIGMLSVGSFLLLFAIPELLGSSQENLSKRELFDSPVIGIARSLQISIFETALQVAAIPFCLWLIAKSRPDDQVELFCLLVLPLIWMATRSGLQGILLGTLFLNGCAVVAFREPASPAGLLQLQTILAVVNVASLYLGILINERTATRDELEERTVYLRALIDDNPLAMIVHDTVGRILLSNPAFERMFGFRRSEISGQKIDALVRSVEKADEAPEFTQRIVSGEPVHVTSVRCRSDGTLLRVEIFGVPLIVRGQISGGIGLYKDISEQTRLQEELLLSQKLQAVGQLAGGVAHDFNNILGIIQGYSESLVETIPASSPLRESVDEILSASKRATGLTRQLLAFGRKQVAQPQILDLNDSVKDMGRMLGRLIGEDIELCIVPGQDLRAIKADPNQIEQIILNLAVNARDAMPNGGRLTLETGNVYLHEQYAAIHAPVPPGRYVMLAVCDDGTGMDPETRSHIFDPFFTTKEKGKGTGLGLSTVYGIVQQTGGHIRVDSEPGKGSAFRLFFPRVADDEELTIVTPGAEQQAVPGTETVLLLEDEPTFRKMTADFLTRSGYTVLVATTGSEATRIVQLHPETIHLLLSDVIMPDINGPQLAKFLSMLRPDMRILFMSGYTDGALEQKEILSESVAFIQKPFSWNSLGLKMREVLELVPVPKGTH